MFNINWRSNVSSQTFVGYDVRNLPTPSLVVYKEKLFKNMEIMTNFIKSNWPNVKLRPHFKAHKTSAIGKLQIDKFGAVGVCCQTLVEAEAAVYGGGISDVFISNQLVGEIKLNRLMDLAKLSKISLCVDSLENVRNINQIANDNNLVIDLVIEINVGQDRCGVMPASKDLLKLASFIEELPNVCFKGIQCYHGWNQHIRNANERKIATIKVSDLAKSSLKVLNDSNITCNYVTGGGTGTFEFEAESSVFTEIQPGSYIFMDVDYNKNLNFDNKFCHQFQQSLFLYTTVQSVSKVKNYCVVDAGMKAISLDSGPPLVVGKETEIEYICGGDEHGILKNAGTYCVGDVIKLVPGHCDPTINLHDELYAVNENELVENIWTINARNCGI